MSMLRVVFNRFSVRLLPGAARASGAALLLAAAASFADPSADENAAGAMSAICTAEAVATLAGKLPGGVVIAKLPQAQVPGPYLPGGVRFKPAANGLPAFCQVTGSFVTNPATGKTAGFLATLPANWNGRYLQVGCGGHCGTFAVSNPANPFITVSTQGKPGDIVGRGYATFATDEGHVGMSAGAWAVQGPGKIDQEAVDDLLYRAHEVLAQTGKAFTEAFYAAMGAAEEKIAYSYMAGCSGGGRDTLVAAARFPESFDGYIAGSPYADAVGTAFQGVGMSAATLRSANADVPPELLALVNPIVLSRCDGKDGVEDGLVQNPMACDFRPEQHLPRCAEDKPGDDCFTQAQIETLSTVLTAVTDEQGRVVQPGYSPTEMQASYRLSTPPGDIATRDPWPDTGNPATGTGGMGTLANATLKVLVHGNDPQFFSRDLLSYGAGGEGDVTGYRIIVPRKAVDYAFERLQMGIGALPDRAEQFIALDRKLLLWVNMSDQLLTPYMSINYYKRLAAHYGGYEKLQRNMRLFSMPGTAHCSGGLLVGPGSVDALDAMVQWVEHGEAPNALLATQYPATLFGVDFNKPPLRTMPLCQFPQMARYRGKGDVNDAANWHCPPGDTGMLEIGESGRQAGVLP